MFFFLFVCFFVLNETWDGQRIMLHYWCEKFILMFWLILPTETITFYHHLSGPQGVSIWYKKGRFLGGVWRWENSTDFLLLLLLLFFLLLPQSQGAAGWSLPGHSLLWKHDSAAAVWGNHPLSDQSKPGQPTRVWTAGDQFKAVGTNVTWTSDLWNTKKQRLWNNGPLFKQ